MVPLKIQTELKYHGWGMGDSRFYGPNGLKFKAVCTFLRYLGRRFASRADEGFAKYFFVPQDPISLVLAVVQKLSFAVGRSV